MGRLIHDIDRDFFNSVAQEVNELAGIVIEYWKLEKGQITYDSLYGEVTSQSSWKFDGPHYINASFEHPEKSPSPEEKGLVTDESGFMVWIARIDWENEMGIDIPVIGDIIKLREKYYDVTQVSRDGWLNSSHTEYTMWKLTLGRVSKIDISKHISC